MSTRAKTIKCIDCKSEGIQTYRPPAKKRDGTLQPGPRCATHHRARRNQTRNKSSESRWLTVYGITADEYWAIYEHQGGVCYICRRATGARKKLAVDHDHGTGFVRGLLCLPCNRNVLGHARDEIEFFDRCIEYLTDSPARQVIGDRPVPGHFLEEEE